MDIQTKDGILLRNIPDGTPDDVIKARIAKIRGEQAPQEQPELRTRLGGLSKTPFNSPNEIIEKGGYEVGGKVTDLTGSPEAGFAANVVTQALPAVAGGYIGKQVGKIGTSMGEGLMRMSLKPSTTISPANTARAVKTALTENNGGLLPGFNVTSGGIEKAQGLLSKQNALEEALIAKNAAKTVNKFDVADAAKSSETLFSNQVAPVADKNAVASIIDEFLTKNPKVPTRTPAQVIPSQSIQSPIVNAQGKNFTQTIPGKVIPASGTDEIPMRIASELKKGTYKTLGDKAYSGELKSAETTTQKALARGLKEGIQKQIPDIIPVNEKQSDLINAMKVMISRNATAGNKDPISLGFLAANPKAALAFMANRSEYVKSILARLLYNTSEATGTAVGAGTAGYGQTRRDNQE